MEIVIAFLCCLAPSLALFFWLRSRQKDKPGYVQGCKLALINGMLSVGPVLAMGLVLSILGGLLGINDRSTVPGALYKCFMVFALAEEASKFLMFRHTLNKTTCQVSWFDAAVFMTLVGVGFGILENVFYAFDLGLGPAIFRGLSIAHGGYGFIMGYFFGKAVKTGKKGYYVLSFGLPYLMHALYDFSLSPILDEYFIFTFIAVTLAVVDVALVVIMIVFFARRAKNEKYTAPLGLKVAAASGEVAAPTATPADEQPAPSGE